MRRSVMAALAGLIGRESKAELKISKPKPVSFLDALTKKREWITPLEWYRRSRARWARRGWTDFRSNGPREVARRRRQMDRGQLAFHHVGPGAESCLHSTKQDLNRGVPPLSFPNWPIVPTKDAEFV